MPFIRVIMAGIAFGFTAGLLCLFPFAWILRDGLGPDSGPRSTGLEAMWKAITYDDWWLYFLLSILVGTPCFVSAWRTFAMDHKARKENPDQSGP